MIGDVVVTESAEGRVGDREGQAYCVAPPGYYKEQPYRSLGYRRVPSWLLLPPYVVSGWNRHAPFFLRYGKRDERV